MMLKRRKMVLCTQWLHQEEIAWVIKVKLQAQEHMMLNLKRPEVNHHRWPSLSLIKMVSTRCQTITLAQANTPILIHLLAQEVQE